jgi:predicted small metal-binding protein
MQFCICSLHLFFERFVNSVSFVWLLNLIRESFVAVLMLTVSCREVGMDCDYVCKGETEEEIMKNAEQHAVQDHHFKAEDILTPEMQQKIKSHIKRS